VPGDRLKVMSLSLLGDAGAPRAVIEQVQDYVFFYINTTITIVLIKELHIFY
jgi:hypothetical protein